MSRVTFQNAKRANGEEISILEAVSGANGYYCIGCNSEMVACIGEVQTPYFRHLAFVGAARECTWSDETYRHKVAKDILQITKSIVVPPVKIPVPSSYGGGTATIQSSRTVHAHRVLIERNVYLDVTGSVRFTKDEESVGNLICVRPDVIFLDSQDKIILMVEICATHKADEEKLAKLRSIGVDTVEVRIPPVPRKEEIEPIFKNYNQTQWLYNYEGANTVFDPNTHTAKRKSPGAVQGRGSVLERESIQCRAFRLRDIIRQLEAYMESGEFGEGRERVDSLIEQTRASEREAEQQLRGFRDRVRRAAEKNVKYKDGLAGQAQRRHRELEERYKLKKEEYRREEDAVGVEEAKLRDKIAAETERLEKRLSEEEGEIERRLEALRITDFKLRRSIDAITEEGNNISSGKGRVKAFIKRTGEQNESAARYRDGLKEDLRKLEEQVERTTEDLQRIRRVRREFSNIQDKAIGGR